MELNKGSRLGDRFKVLGCLGSGKTGTLFVAADADREDSVVALKVLHQQLLKEPATQRRLRDRISEFEDLHEGNLVQLIEFVDQPDLKAVAFEYVPGGNVQALTQDSPFSLSESIEVLRQTALALALLHHHRIVHAALQPTSILFNADGFVKLGGFALLLEPSPALSVGTAHYSAPEYLRSGSCDERSDIYSLGVIGSELICRNIPPDLDDNAAAAEAGLKPWPADCPTAIRAVIEKAMAPNPFDRFQSAAEFEQALVQARDSGTFSPRRKSSIFLCLIAVYLWLLLFAMHMLSQA